MNEDLTRYVRDVMKSLQSERGWQDQELPEIELVITKDPAHGDFATNLAFRLAKLAKAKPSDVAKDLVLRMQSGEYAQSHQGLIEHIEIAGAGFINFYLTKKTMGTALQDVLRDDAHYGMSQFGKGKKVLVEYVSANPTGPLTIAHGRQAAIGDSLVRILRATGHEVQAEYYLNDAGRQMRLLGESLWVRYQNLFGKNIAMPEEGYQGHYLIAMAEQTKARHGDALLKKNGDEAVRECTRIACDVMMAEIRRDLDQMRVHFDSYFSEGQLYANKEVDKTLDVLKEKKFLYEQDGALWFRSTEFGDDKDRVVRKSSGEMTYLAPDIAYHRYKFSRGFNWLVNLLGPDHHGYVPRLKAACQALGFNPDQLDVRIVQLCTLYRQGEPVRMSTRAGEFVSLAELTQEVGADAARFFFIMRRTESHLDFDLDLAKEKSQENPVYYLQYAHARIASLLAYAGREVLKDVRFDLLASDQEAQLIKRILEYPKILISASELLEPYRLADYLRELAVCFHKFYSAHRIVGDDAELTKARLLLSDAARIVLRNGLELLGISQPESM